VIYCVVPPELATDFYDELVEHYKDNPNVTVIVDRREGPNRRGRHEPSDERRQTRDRRRARVPGTFPGTDAPDAA